MTEVIQPKSTIELATEIVVAYLGQRSMEPSELAGFIREVRAALECQVDVAETGGVRPPTSGPIELVATEGRRIVRPNQPPSHPVALQPAVAVDESIFPDYLVSLEDGARYRSLRRHLMAKYGLTPDEYRQKWSLPADYPMVAPNYARERSEVARRSGLGKRGKTKIVDQNR